jgi:sialate O-acetylesterase
MAISPQADVKGCLPGIGLEPEDANGLVRERKNGWQPCTPDTADDISAVPYYFGAALAEKLQVPVGLVTSSVGGSPIRRWMKGGNIFNGMIAPFGPMYLKGVVWYQGESDIGDPAGVYASHFTQMIQYWRGEFNNGEMPFYFVQIAPFGNNAAAAQLREEQASALTLKNTGMAVISDVGDPACIHPRNKRDVGRRLARQALSKTYGCPDVIADGPIFKSAQLQGGSTQVTFSDQGGGLVSRDGKSLTCFTIAGSDGKFQPAIAELAGTTVIVTCPHVPQPTEIRFGWGPSDQPNLMSKSGLPAAQFRSAIR